jgi:hypothetical protein
VLVQFHGWATTSHVSTVKATLEQRPTFAVGPKRTKASFFRVGPGAPSKRRRPASRIEFVVFVHKSILVFSVAVEVEGDVKLTPQYLCRSSGERNQLRAKLR